MADITQLAAVPKFRNVNIRKSTNCRNYKSVKFIVYAPELFIPATSPSRGNKIWWRISSYSKDTRRAKPNMKHCHPGFFFQAMSSHIRGSFCLFLWIFTTLLLTAAAAANAAPSGCPCCRCSCSWQAANPLFLMRKYIFMNTKNSGMSKFFQCFDSNPKKW